MSGDTLITIDPGKNACGVARFLRGNMTWCGYLYHHLDKAPPPAAIVIVETPVVYDRRKWKGDQNDLIAIALWGGLVAGRCSNEHSVIIPVLPATWKGQAPKDVMNERVFRAMAAKERERLDLCGVPPSKRHNVLDAIGIGLWKLGRI